LIFKEFKNLFSRVCLMLTTGVDNFPGTTGVDVFQGTISNLAGTLQATDKIDGGDGTSDRLELAQSIDWSGFTTGSVKNVETVQLTNSGGTARTFNASGISDAKHFILNAANAGFTLVDLPSGVNQITLNGQTTGTLTTNFKAGAAETSPTALTDKVTLNLNGVGGTTDAPIDVNLGSIEELAINSVGTNNIDDLGATRKMSVAGSGDITIRTVPTSLTEFDGSAATGKITATLSAVTGGGLKSIKGGAGADSITLVQAGLPSTATIDGGAGSDTLNLTSAGGTTLYKMTGVEHLSLTAVTGAALNFIASDVKDLSKVTTVAAVAQSVTFTDMGNVDMEFVSSGATVQDGAVASDHTGATVVNYSALAATTSARTITAGINPLADYTFSKAPGKLTVNVNDLVANAGSTITAAKASSVELNVATGKNKAGTELTEFASTITAEEATSIKVNALGKVTGGEISAAKATSAEIVNGENEFTLDLATPELTTLSIKTGANLGVDGTTILSKLQTLTAAADKGTVTFGNDLAAINSLTLSGSGSDSKVVLLGALGAIGNGYGLSLTASGLKAGVSADPTAVGLQIGNIVIGKGYDVSLNLSGMSGGATITTINDTVTNSLPKDITINAAGMGGTLNIGAIKGSGNVTVNAKGAYDVALSTIQGATVTVDVSGTTESGGIVIGNITAKSSVNVSYQTGATNTRIINATEDSTALSVTVNGGALKDDITINGDAASTTITVAGNLGATDDIVTVNNTGSKAKGINISALLNYDKSELYGGAGSQTIVGGNGDDIIWGGAGADTLTGNGGKNSFRFNAGDSAFSAPDTITDFKLGDEIWIGFGGYADTAAFILGKAAAKDATDAGTSAAVINEFGVATFANMTTAPTTLQLAAQAVNTSVGASSLAKWAYFQFGGNTYLFVDGDDSATLSSSDLVINLVGVPVPSFTLTDAASDTTGLSGFGA
jgi:hypothetical protein